MWVTHLMWVSQWCVSQIVAMTTGLWRQSMFTTVTCCHGYWIVKPYPGCRGFGVVTSQHIRHSSGVVTSGCVEIFNVQSYLSTKIAFNVFHGLCGENTFHSPQWSDDDNATAINRSIITVKIGLITKVKTNWVFSLVDLKYLKCNKC
jgi:hypothetical protein